MIKESESFGEISAKILDFSQLDSETGEEFQPTNIYLLIHDSISIKCLTWKKSPSYQRLFKNEGRGSWT